MQTVSFLFCEVITNDTIFISPKLKGRCKFVALEFERFLHIGYCDTFIHSDFGADKNCNPCRRNLVLRIFNYPYG